MTRVLIVDDHPVVREGYKKILGVHPEFNIAGEASTGKEAMDKLKGEAWDVVLLDISLPDVNGIELLGKVRAMKPKLAVMAVAGHVEEDIAAQVLREGANGFLTKDCTPEQVIGAIEKILEGGRFISPSVVEGLTMRLLSRPDKALHESLSEREMQVMSMIVVGKKPKEIAEELKLSIKTVSTHRTRILQKMRMRSNAELVRYAMRYRLVADDKDPHGRTWS